MMMLRRHGRNLRTSIQLGKMRPGSSTGGDSPSTFSILTGDTTQFPVSAYIPSSRASASTANILDTPYWIPYHQAIQFAMHMINWALKKVKLRKIKPILARLARMIVSATTGFASESRRWARAGGGGGAPGAGGAGQ